MYPALYISSSCCSPPACQLLGLMLLDPHTHTRLHHTQWESGFPLKWKTGNWMTLFGAPTSAVRDRKSKQLPPPKCWDADAGNLGMPATQAHAVPITACSSRFPTISGSCPVTQLFSGSHAPLWVRDWVLLSNFNTWGYQEHLKLRIYGAKWFSRYAKRGSDS